MYKWKKSKKKNYPASGIDSIIFFSATILILNLLTKEEWKDVKGGHYPEKAAEVGNGVSDF